MQRPKLTDIIKGSEGEKVTRAWDSTSAAPEFGPLPAGVYEARVLDGKFAQAKTGTTGYELTFQVLGGEYANRRFWYTLWLTPAAMPFTKRDLAKLGIHSLDDLNRPLARGIRCRVNLALRVDDNGREYNRVRSFEVLGVDEPERDPFAPQDAPEATGEAGTLTPSPSVEVLV